MTGASVPFIRTRRLPTERGVGNRLWINAILAALTTLLAIGSPPFLVGQTGKKADHPPQASGPPMLAHFPLDGSPVNRANGEPGRIVALEGDPPQVVAGKHGRAYRFLNGSFIASPLNVDPSLHPRLTITAWVKRPAELEVSSVAIVSGGEKGAVPVLRLMHDDLRGHAAGAQPVHYAGGIQAETWTFVAGVWDYPSQTLRLHTGAASQAFRSKRMDPVKLERQGQHQPTARPPNDPDAEPRRYVYIGAMGFNGARSGGDVAIDDVRVYSGALNNAALARLGARGSGFEPVVAERRPPDANGGAPERIRSGEAGRAEQILSDRRKEDEKDDDADDNSSSAPTGNGYDPSPLQETEGIRSPGQAVFTDPKEPDEIAGEDEKPERDQRTDSISEAETTAEASAQDRIERVKEILERDSDEEQAEANQSGADYRDVLKDAAYNDEEKLRKAAEAARDDSDYTIPDLAEAAAEAETDLSDRPDEPPTPTEPKVALSTGEGHIFLQEIHGEDLEIPGLNEENRFEPYLMRFEFRGRIGQDRIINVFDGSEHAHTIRSGRNWMKKDDRLSLPRSVGRVSFEDLKPYELFGVVYIIVERNRMSAGEQSAFLEEIWQVLSRRWTRTLTGSQAFDFSDRSHENARRIVAHSVARLFDEFHRELDYELHEVEERQSAQGLFRMRDMIMTILPIFWINAPEPLSIYEGAAYEHAFRQGTGRSLNNLEDAIDHLARNPDETFVVAPPGNYSRIADPFPRGPYYVNGITYPAPYFVELQVDLYRSNP